MMNFNQFQPIFLRFHLNKTKVTSDFVGPSLLADFASLASQHQMKSQGHSSVLVNSGRGCFKIRRILTSRTDKHSTFALSPAELKDEISFLERKWKDQRKTSNIQDIVHSHTELQDFFCESECQRWKLKLDSNLRELHLTINEDIRSTRL